MKQSTQIWTRGILGAAIGLLAVLVLLVPVRPASAQNSTDPLATDELDTLMEQFDRLIGALVTADLDQNGVADFDASGDGVAELPLSNFADLPAAPGSEDFSQLLRTTLEVGIGPVSNETSLSPECSAMALSFDAQGNLIDWALGTRGAEGAGSSGMILDLFPQSATGTKSFTQQNPFVVGDRVVLIGDISTDIAGTSEHGVAWTVSSAGVPVGSGATSARSADGVGIGDVEIADHAIGGFAEPVGVFPIDTRLEIADLLCATTGWVEFDQGLPLLTNVGIAASGLSVVGALGLFLHARPARAWKTEEKA